MDLVINVDALDKSQAAVVSAADLTAVDELRQLVLGTQEPLSIVFVDEDGAVVSWQASGSVTIAVGLGSPNVNGEATLTATDDFTAANPRVGELNLNTAALRQALYQFCAGRTPGSWLTLEIAKTDASGSTETLALLNVFVKWRVLTYPITESGLTSVGFKLVTAPTSPSDPGNVGEAAYDDEFFYVYTPAGSWARTPISDWS